MPKFGDKEAIRKMRESQLTSVIDQERKLNGKVFTVRVEFTLRTEETRDIEVIAIDDDDAENMACEKILEEESDADEDNIDTRILSVREQGVESNNLELFPKE